MTPSNDRVFPWSKFLVQSLLSPTGTVVIASFVPVSMMFFGRVGYLFLYPVCYLLASELSCSFRFGHNDIKFSGRCS